MPRHDDYWDETAEEDENAATIPCPYCQRPILEDSVQCPYCKNYLSDEDAPPARRAWWIVAGVILCLVIVFFWITAF